VTLGPNGQSHEAGRLGSSPPIVIEADKDARHDAVLATLERFKNETLVLVPALDQNGKIIALPIPMAPAAREAPKSAIWVVRYPTARREATLIGPDGARRAIKIADSCPGSPACPLAVALQDLEARESGGPSVVYLDIAGSTPWSQTLNVVSNAYCSDSSGNMARWARNISLLTPSLLTARPNHSRKGTN
jgi:hypothetical protein